MNLSRYLVAVVAVSVAILLVISLSAYREATEEGGPPQEDVGDVKSYQTVVRPHDDGSLLLHAEEGQGIGSEIEYMPEWQAYGWFDTGNRVEWDVLVDETRRYEVYLEWSVSDEEAGKQFAFVAGDQQVTGTVGRTGSWEEYDIEKIGEMNLSPGRTTMVFKPNEEFKKGGALLDLRGVYLVPQTLVRPLPDGSLLLHAEDGRAYGPEVQYMPEWQAYGWFTASSSDLGWDVSSRVEWDVEVGSSGEYEVYLEWSVSDEAAGKPIMFVAGDQKLTGTVGRTGSWAEYDIEKIGEMELSSGQKTMTFLPDPEFEEGGAVLDLRGVYLVPGK